MAANSYRDVLLFVDKIRLQRQRSPGLGNGPFSDEALDVIADALSKVSRLPGPGMPSSTPQAVIDAYRCGEFSTVSPCPTPCACDDMAHHDYQLIRRILATSDRTS